MLGLLMKLFGHRGLKYHNGIYSIWNVPMFFVSYDSFINLADKFENLLGDEFNQLFYALGFVQAFNGTNILVKKFGINVLQKNFDSFLQGQGDMLGLGSFNFTKDIPNKFFQSECENKIAQRRFQIKGVGSNFQDYYLRGICAGAISASFEEDYFCVERKCICHGDANCLFEMKPYDEFDLDDPIVGKQFFDNRKLIYNILEKENLASLLKR